MRTPFDYRWIVLIALVILLLNVGRLPPVVLIVLLGAGGGWLLYTGWQTWTRRSGGGGGGTRVTYWRGERVELKPQRRGPAMPRLSDIGPALVYLLIGGAMLVAAGSMLLDVLRLM